MLDAMTEHTPQPAPLKPLPEDWSKAVAIVAHPDDLEFGAAAAIARWTGQGKEVVYVMVTSGEAGIDGLDPEECRRVREAEQVESARVVGVDTVEFLGFPDGTLEYGLPLRAAVAEVVRRHRPEIVVTGNFRDTFGPGALNQADHIAAGRAVLDGVRDAANRWIFPEQLRDGLEKWTGVRAVWASGSPEARHGVDTTATFEAGVESLKAHRAYIDGLGWDDFDEREMLEGFSRMGGTRMGVTYAAVFEVYSLTWGGVDEE
jgi:LmbE family N-acetylglucosaminyl deacetylase